MKQPAAAGFDVGTSSLKAVLADPDGGAVLGGRTWQYEAGREAAPGVLPIAVYEHALLSALRDLAADYQLVSLALTTQMYSICRRTPQGLLVYQWNALWRRDAAVEAALGETLVRSGCRADTLYPAYKLATLPPAERASFLPYGLKEHLLRLLTGELATDYSTASTLGVFDAVGRKWNLDAARDLGLDTALLPPAVPHDTPVGRVREDLLPGGAVVAPGLGDGPAASFACRDVSLFCGNLGTSMAARVITDTPDFSAENGLWNYAFDDTRFATGGISSNACTVLHWARDLGLDPGDTLADSREVLFLPWLHGERMPFWSSDLRGTFLGLQIGDGPQVLRSAVAKAVAFTFCRMALALEPVTAPDRPLILAGGGTNVRPVLTAVAGCLHRDLALLENETYLGATGAAMSAGAAAGCRVRPELRIRETIRPTRALEGEYTRWTQAADRMAAFYQ